MLKIAVNTRLLLPGKLEGIGWFSFQSLKRIVNAHPEHRFCFLFDRPWDESFVFADNVHPVRLYPQARHPVLYYLFFEIAVARYLHKMQADLFFSPDGFLTSRFAGPQLPVFHDLNFMHNPEFIPGLSRKYYTRFFPKFARKATRIATVSDYSRQDIAQTFAYPQDRIDVVYNGAHEIFAPVNMATQKATRERFTRGCPYFVYIGSLHKRKNIDQMLRAFDLFRSRAMEAYKLVIVGAPMFGSGETEKVLREMHHAADVIMTGRLYDDDLRNIVASARALLLVSHFEGFGIPIIEAMQCDVPVITSNVTAMPEVAGDAALLAEPGSVEQIARAMHTMAKDDKLRQDLIEKGRRQRQRFSWDQTAKRLWQSMEKCVQT